MRRAPENSCKLTFSLNFPGAAPSAKAAPLIHEGRVLVLAPNAFRCTAVQVDDDPVDAAATMRVSATNDIGALVTRGAAEDLRLAPGRSVVALIKSSFVMLAPPRRRSAHRAATCFWGDGVRRWGPQQRDQARHRRWQDPNRRRADRKRR